MTGLKPHTLVCAATSLMRNWVPKNFLDRTIVILNTARVGKADKL